MKYGDFQYLFYGISILDGYGKTISPGILNPYSIFHDGEMPKAKPLKIEMDFDQARRRAMRVKPPHKPARSKEKKTSK